MWNLTRALRLRFSAVRLNYLHFDNGQKNNLVVCHGLMGSHKNFRNICRNPLIASHANCYLVDARNHGDSPHTDSHTVQQLADDIAEFIKQHKLSNVTFMGHSMGGLAVMAFSKLYHDMQNIVDNLIIVDISNRIGAVGSSNKTLLNQLNKLSLNNKPIDQIYKELETVSQSKDVVGLLKTNIAPSKSSPNQYIWKPNIQALHKHYDDLVNFYLKEPTLWSNPIDIIYGSKSEYVDLQSILEFKQVYQQITDDNIHRIEGAGHWLHFQKPKQFLSVIDGIFRKQGK